MDKMLQNPYPKVEFGSYSTNINHDHSIWQKGADAQKKQDEAEIAKRDRRVEELVAQVNASQGVINNLKSALSKQEVEITRLTTERNNWAKEANERSAKDIAEINKLEAKLKE